VLHETASAFPGRLPSYEPRVLLTEFGDFAVGFEVSVWVHDPWLSRVARSDLHEAIWWALKRHKVTIPFPQRDVHLIPPPRTSVVPDATPVHVPDATPDRAR
jgi:small-conductance mechanosensitive channel